MQPEKRKRIDAELDRCISIHPAPYQLLFEAARYALFSGGKRFRPLLTLAATEACGAPLEQGLAPACAIELIHTYSLIQDDLPCMDDDDYRRGKPTLHRLYPEGIALLASDYLLTYSFELVAKAPQLTPAQRLETICLLSQASGTQGMIGGQCLDLLLTSQPSVSPAQLDTLHHLKTGALICAAIEIGAIAASASVEQRRALKQFGRELGIAFQIADDIVDSDDQDAAHGKTTYVTLHGPEEAYRQMEQHKNEALAALQPFGTPARSLVEIAETILNPPVAAPSR